MNFPTMKPEEMTPEEIAAVLPFLESWITWSKEVQSRALELAKKGVEFQSYEVKEYYGHRKFIDKEKVAKLLVKKGYAKESIYEEQLLSPARLESLLGSEVFLKLLKNHITQETLYKLVQKKKV